MSHSNSVPQLLLIEFLILLILDEFVDSGGAELASRMGAFSADHLMVCSGYVYVKMTFLIRMTCV
jgi:hypothetical protein